MITRAESRRSHHVRCRFEFSFHVLAPCVVWALDPALQVATLFLLQSGATVSADVVEAVDLPRFASDDQKTFAVQFMEKKITGFRNIRCSTRADPTWQEYPTGFLLIHGW